MNVIDHELVRAPAGIPVEELTDEQIRALAEPAADPVLTRVKALGYEPPSVKAQEEERRARVAAREALVAARSRRMAKILHVLKLDPFTPESVEKFKRRKARHRLQMYDRPESTLIAVSSVFLLISGWLVNVFLGIWAGDWLTQHLHLSFSLSNLGWTPVVAFLAIMVTRNRSGFFWPSVALCVFFNLPLAIMLACGPAKSWQTVSLKEYAKEIPREVLANVAEISARCPDAKFFVDELTDNPDPFMVVRLGKGDDEECYHFDVWEEPDFHGKRLVV